MSTTSRALTASFVAAFLASAAGNPAWAQKAKPIDIPLLIELHNKNRADEKLGPLKADPKLEAAAKVQAKDMAEQGKMDHAGSDGSTPAERVTRQHYLFQKTGENVAAGQSSSREVMKAWMNSPHHKENVLGDYTQIGAACYVADDGIPYWCVTFGKPWPEVDPKKDAEALIKAMNKAREGEKLPELKTQDILQAAATRHAKAIAAAGKFVKKDDEGKTAIERASDDGYGYRSLGAVLAMGQSGADEVVQSWLGHPENRKAVLGDYQDIGVGVAATKDGVPCWSILLGKPAAP